MDASSPRIKDPITTKQAPHLRLVTPDTRQATQTIDGLAENNDLTGFTGRLSRKWFLLNLLLANVIFYLFAAGLTLINLGTIRNVVVPLLSGDNSLKVNAGIPELFWLSCIAGGGMLIFLSYVFFGLLHRRVNDIRGTQTKATVATLLTAFSFGIPVVNILSFCWVSFWPGIIRRPIETVDTPADEVSRSTVFTGSGPVLALVQNNAHRHHAKFYLIKENGEETGPFSAAHIKQMLDYREVSTRDKVRPEGAVESKMIGALSEIMTASRYAARATQQNGSSRRPISAVQISLGILFVGVVGFYFWQTFNK